MSSKQMMQLMLHRFVYMPVYRESYAIHVEKLSACGDIKNGRKIDI